MKRVQFLIVIDLELLLASSSGIRNVELHNKKLKTKSKRRMREKKRHQQGLGKKGTFILQNRRVDPLRELSENSASAHVREKKLGFSA